MAALLPRHKDGDHSLFQLSYCIQCDPGASADQDEDGIEAIPHLQKILGRVKKGAVGGGCIRVEIHRRVDSALIGIRAPRVVEVGVPAFGIQDRKADRGLILDGHWKMVRDTGFEPVTPTVSR